MTSRRFHSSEGYKRARYLRTAITIHIKRKESGKRSHIEILIRIKIEKL